MYKTDFRQKFSIFRKPEFLIAAVILVSWSPIVWSKSLTWDDWVARSASSADLSLWARQMGRLSTFLTFPLSHPAFASFGAPAVRSASLFAMVGTGLLAYSLSQRLGTFDRIESQFIGFFLGVLPVDTTRSMITTSMYVWCLFIFYGATRLSVCRSRLLFVLSLPLFFVSFETSSLLVFLVFPCLLISLESGLTSRERMFRVLLLIGTGAIFWVVKIQWFTPFGSYEGYNRIGVHGIMTVIVGLGGVLIFARILWLAHQAGVLVLKGNSGIIAVGILFATVGLLPYAAVGNYPPFVGTGTRHYTASGLGLSLVLVGIVRMVGRGNTRRKALAHAGLTGTCIAFVWLNCVLSLNYWAFQNEAELFFESSPVPENTVVVLELDESRIMKLSRFLGPNFALTWYVPTGWLDPGADSSSLAVMEGDLDKVMTGRIKCCPPERPWADSPGLAATNRVYVRIRPSEGVLGLFQKYDFNTDLSIGNSRDVRFQSQ